MRKPVILKIAPDKADQQVTDGWQFARQRDFTGGESLAKLPEMVKRSQLIRMENAIISPEGEVTECWQMDQALFVNVSGGIVVAPIHGSPLFTVYGASGENVISFTFDPSNPVPYDMNAASDYPGYVLRAHIDPVTILGVSHGTPFLGKNYCCASTNLYISGGTGGVAVPPTPGQLTASPSAITFGTCEMLTTNRVDVTVMNATALPVTLTALNYSGSGAAVFGDEADLPQTIAAGGTYTFPATYIPPAAEASNAVLDIVSNIGILQRGVNGTATPAVITATPASVDFGTVQVLTNQQINVTVTNTTLSPVTLTGASGGGGFGIAFGHTGAFPQTLAAAETYTFAITFNPLTMGVSNAALNIHSNLGILQVSVSGIATMMLSSTPAVIDFPEAYAGNTFESNVVIDNTGTRAVKINSIVGDASIGLSSATGPLPAMIPAGGSMTVTATITPPSEDVLASTLQIVADVGTLSVPVTGYAPHPLSAPDAAFGPVSINTDSMLFSFITNNGAHDVIVTALSAPPPAGSSLFCGIFSIATGVLLFAPLVVPAGGQVRLILSFNPTLVGPVATSAQVVTTFGTLTIPITGTAI